MSIFWPKKNKFGPGGGYGKPMPTGAGIDPSMLTPREREILEQNKAKAEEVVAAADKRTRVNKVTRTQAARAAQPHTQNVQSMTPAEQALNSFIVQQNKQENARRKAQKKLEEKRKSMTPEELAASIKHQAAVQARDATKSANKALGMIRKASGQVPKKAKEQKEAIKADPNLSPGQKRRAVGAVNRTTRQTKKNLGQQRQNALEQKKTARQLKKNPGGK